MWIYSFVFSFTILIFSLLFIIGLILLILGKGKWKPKLASLGLKMLLTPIIILGLLLIFSFVWELISTKPNKNNIVGKYVSTQNEGYEIKLSENGGFESGYIPAINLCQSGKFTLDKVAEEIRFECLDNSSFAKIDRGLGSYKIQFVIGDPDSGESIYFQKTKD